MLAGGCASFRTARENTDAITKLHLITAPVALNFDGIPGPDGFSLKVYATSPKNPKPVPIRTGEQLEIAMYNGSLVGFTNAPPALKTWKFTLPELKNHEFKSSIGTGYDFILHWGTNRPSERLATIIARYTLPGGNVARSSPTSVTVIDQ